MGLAQNAMSKIAFFYLLVLLLLVCNVFDIHCIRVAVGLKPLANNLFSSNQ